MDIYEVHGKQGKLLPHRIVALATVRNGKPEVYLSKMPRKEGSKASICAIGYRKAPPTPTPPLDICQKNSLRSA